MNERFEDREGSSIDERKTRGLRRILDRYKKDTRTVEAPRSLNERLEDREGSSIDERKTRGLRRIDARQDLKP